MKKNMYQKAKSGYKAVKTFSPSRAVQKAVVKADVKMTNAAAKVSANPRVQQATRAVKAAASVMKKANTPVGEGLKKAAFRIDRALDTPSSIRGGARAAVQQAGKRAAVGVLGGVGAVIGAGMAGYAAGSAINKRFGISDAIVDRIAPRAEFDPGKPKPKAKLVNFASELTKKGDAYSAHTARMFAEEDAALDSARKRMKR